jgi:hypothetical protein
MRYLELIGAVLLAGCAPLHTQAKSIPAPAEQAKLAPAPESVKPLGATWRLKPAGTLDAMRSPDEEAAMAPSAKVPSRLDPGPNDAVAFGGYWWRDPSLSSVVLVYPATLVILEFPLRLRFGMKLLARWR